jgi:hypothetical protein
VTARARLALLALVSACLEVPTEEPPMCHTTADCDEGEICEEHVCWGNPPEGPFAAVVSPPSERSADLATREVLMLPIAGDGWIEDVHLDGAAAFKGRLVAQCDECVGRKLGATITITRPSVFAGGPGFRKVVAVEANDESFEIKVPATRDGDAKYTVTVVPDGRDAPGGGTGESLAQLVPPLQAQVAVPANVSSSEILALGGPGLHSISGSVVTSLPTGVGGYRVVALGRWQPDQPLTEVSTVDFTGVTGNFMIFLSRGLIGTVELVARPYDAQLLPELRLTGVSATQPSIDKVLALPAPNLGTRRVVEILVDHKETGGEIAPVAGATVTISSSFSPNMTASARLVAEATTDERGAAYLELLDMEEIRDHYKLSIRPQPNSKASALFAKDYALQSSMMQRLGTRIAITGMVLGADGTPVQDVSITARPSVRFLWNLEAGPQAFLGSIPTATVVTPETGEFVLFVDHAFTSGSGPQQVTVWGHYDLTFEPTKKARVPSWTRTDVELPRNDAQSTLALGPIHLPDAAYVRGHVFDDENARLEGAEVKLYRVQRNDALCLETRFEPQSCPIPPLLMGRAASEQDGVARLTLPR